MTPVSIGDVCQKHLAVMATVVGYLPYFQIHMEEAMHMPFSLGKLLN